MTARKIPQTDKEQPVHVHPVYIEQRSSDGFCVLVGRSAQKNDVLTFHIARQNDFWFHVAATSGAHVIVCNPDNLSRLPKATLRQAAALAVWHSKSRTGGRVAVHCARVREVSKKRGSPAGQVILRRFESVRVSVDDRPVSKKS
jgi:predicted ribosome quality control (RQC) complex YloA/Tae2 family protein